VGVGSVPEGDGVVVWPPGWSVVGVPPLVWSGPGVPVAGAVADVDADGDAAGVVAPSELSAVVVAEAAGEDPGAAAVVALDCCPVGVAVGVEGLGSGAEVVPPCLDDVRALVAT
jgi:hypothetical protein